MRKILLASAGVMVISAGTVYAACIPTPDCASLGYTASANSGNCLKCPWGNTWFCPEGGSSGCQPEDCSGFTLTQEQTTLNTGTYEQCIPGCGDDIPRYKLISCNNGYYASGGKCIENSCNNYPYISKPSSIDHCLTIGSCQKGKKTVYGCTKCEDGYGDDQLGGYPDDGNCPPVQCSDSCFVHQGIFSVDSFNRTSPESNCIVGSSYACFKGQKIYYSGCSNINCW